MKSLPALCLLIVCLSVSAGPVGGDFQLETHDGRPWSTQQARGQVLVVSFGYTFCPDICPTALATITAAMRELGGQSEQVQPLFITLDPERDTPEKLASYVRWFHPRIIGLTGTAEELKQLAERYRVRYSFVGKGEKEHYTLDHSANLYLIDQEGKLSGILPHGLPPEALVSAISALLEEGKGERVGG